MSNPIIKWLGKHTGAELQLGRKPLEIQFINRIGRAERHGHHDADMAEKLKEMQHRIEDLEEGIKEVVETAREDGPDSRHRTIAAGTVSRLRGLLAGTFTYMEEE